MSLPFARVFSVVVAGMCLGVAIGFAWVGDFVSAELFTSTAAGVGLIQVASEYAEQTAPPRDHRAPATRRVPALHRDGVA